MSQRFLLTGLVLVAVVGFACSSDKGQDQVPVSEPIVQIAIGVGTGEEFTPAFSGSGTVIDSDGLILTNLHVVDPELPWDSIAIYTVDDPKQPPQLSYFAAIASFDTGLDIAVLKIVANSRGEAVSVDGLPTVVLGNSDSVEVGDDLQILGFPDIGGDTLTLTEGIVSGFVSDPSRPAQSRWIKTDAEISNGNSGGAALNEGEELVAIPTAILVGAESPTALGQLLPINFASDLLVEARATRPSQYVTHGRDGGGLASDDAELPVPEAPDEEDLTDWFDGLGDDEQAAWLNSLPECNPVAGLTENCNGPGCDPVAGRTETCNQNITDAVEKAIVDWRDSQKSQCTYSGPYKFSGSTKTVTDDFCITADMVRVEYSARGIGDHPDYYRLGIWLYDEVGGFRDAEYGLEGSGRVNLTTHGGGFFYLQLEPDDAAWEVTISQ